MFLALMATLALADPPLPGAQAPLPYMPALAGEGRGLHLVDLDGAELPTPQALEWLDLPEAADAYRRRTRLRHVGAIAMWASAPPVIFFGGIYGAVYGPPLALALIGGGFTLWFVRPERHLGAWVDEGEVKRRLATWTPTAYSTSKRERLLSSHLLYLDEEGRLVTEERQPVRMEQLLQLIPDPEMEERWQRTRRGDKATWGTVTAVGGTLAVGSVLAGGYLDDLFHVDDRIITLVGGSVGVAGVGAGVTGLVLSARRHDDPSTWYSQPELEERLGQQEGDLRERLQLPPPPPSGARLELVPILGPGMVGLAGTF